MSDQLKSEATGEIKATVVVAQVLPQPVKDVWAVLMTDEGAEALLGEGGRLGAKGSAWRSNDGHNGVTRSFPPLEQIRFSWRSERATDKASMVNLELSPEDGGTRINLTHSDLWEEADYDTVLSHWKKALRTIAELAARG